MMEQPSGAVNPQASLCDLSWLGGVIDTLGCITVAKKTSGRNVTPFVTALITNPLIMNKMLEVFGKYGIAFYCREYQATKRWDKKWKITIHGYKRVRNFLPIILPHLVAKLSLAELVMSLSEDRIDSNFTPYSDREKALCQRIWHLNGRGTKLWKSHKSLNDHTQGRSPTG